MNRGSETDSGTIWDESREQKLIKTIIQARSKQE